MSRKKVTVIMTLENDLKQAKTFDEKLNKIIVAGDKVKIQHYHQFKKVVTDLLGTPGVADAQKRDLSIAVAKLKHTREHFDYFIELTLPYLQDTVELHVLWEGHEIERCIIPEDYRRKIVKFCKDKINANDLALIRIGTLSLINTISEILAIKKPTRTLFQKLQTENLEAEAWIALRKILLVSVQDPASRMVVLRHLQKLANPSLIEQIVKKIPEVMNQDEFAAFVHGEPLAEEEETGDAFKRAKTVVHKIDFLSADGLPEEQPADENQNVAEYYEHLKEGRAGSESKLAELYYQGKTVTKNDFVARQLLVSASQKKTLTVSGALLLAKMCFCGEGGAENVMFAMDLYHNLEDSNQLPRDAEALYYYGECFYLLACLPENERESEKLLERAQKLWQLSFELGSGDASLSLQALEYVASGETEPSEEQWSEAKIAEKVDFYRGKHDGEWNCLTTLCYQIQHQGWKSPETQFYFTVLKRLNPDYGQYSESELLVILKNKEQAAGTYFGEEVPEDSDSDREVKYHANTKTLTANQTDALKIIEKLKKTTTSFIEKIMDNTEADLSEKIYSEIAGRISSAYTSSFNFTLGANRSAELQAVQDQEVLMRDASRMGLGESLGVVTTHFYVPQKRGLHFFRDKFSAKDVKRVVTQIMDPAHPLNEKPIYASAVYEIASVKTLMTTDPVECHKLAQAARLLTYQLQELYQSSERFEKLPPELKEFLDAGLETGYLQSHQCYTSSYVKYINQFLPFLQRAKLLSASRVPYVSTADIQSRHSEGYASGSKVYDEHREQRLRPCYDAELRAQRPYVGMVYLMLNPLGDYADGTHLHVPTANAQGRLNILSHILAERECSFFAKVPAGRVRHIEEWKFPSFDHERYLKIMALRYGLNESLYNAFRDAISKTKPHEFRRRLIVLLLGEHIGAFKTHFLYDRAQKIVTKESLESGKRSYLLYRTLDGGFSMRPNQEANARPSGTSDPQVLRRLHTHMQHEGMKKRDREDLEEQEVPDDFEQTLSGREKMTQKL